MKNTTPHQRVLAIDPGSGGFGFAVLEGAERLVDWGVAGTTCRNDRELLGRAVQLIERYRPDVFVVEDCSAPSSRRRQRACRLIRAMAQAAIERKVGVRRFARDDIRKAFKDADTLPTKHRIAVAIVELFPELVLRLPPLRRPWMSEDYRMSIFDAVALTVTTSMRDRRSSYIDEPAASAS
jgi:hypothetical protein